MQTHMLMVYVWMRRAYSDASCRASWWRFFECLTGCRRSDNIFQYFRHQCRTGLWWQASWRLVCSSTGLVCGGYFISDLSLVDTHYAEMQIKHISHFPRSVSANCPFDRLALFELIEWNQFIDFPLCADFGLDVSHEIAFQENIQL